MKFHLDWFTITVHTDERIVFELWDQFFRKYLGPLEDQNHGVLGFKELWRGMLGMLKVKGTQGNYHSFEFTGEAMKVLSGEQVFEFLNYIYDRGIKFKVTRLDFAFDHVPWTVKEFYGKLLAGKFKSRATRASIKFYEQPFETNEAGKKGTRGVYLGSRSSDRHIVVYDQHGYTRLELRLSGDTAEHVGIALAASSGSKSWIGIGLSALKDFVTIEAKWWDALFQGDIAERITIYTASELSTARKEKWIAHQVAPSLAALVEMHGNQWLWEVLQDGKSRQGPQIKAMISNSKENPNEITN